MGSEDNPNAGAEVRWQTCCHLTLWLAPAPQLAFSTPAAGRLDACS